MVPLFALIWYNISTNMNTTQITHGQIKISVSPALKSLVQSRAQNIGVPVTQYVKNLIVNDVKQSPVFQVDEETERRIGESLKALKERKYTVIRNEEELEEHLDSLNQR